MADPADATRRPNATPLLEATGVVKRFGPVQANDVTSFAVHAGEIVGLVGENGAGKSTLCKILYGYYRPDAGEFRVAGKPVRISSPHEARRHGIGMVFQNFSLIPALTVWENVALYLEDLPWTIGPAELRRRMGKLAERLRLNVNLNLPVGSLAVGERQKVEILKQLLAGARVLMLDEPTKVLAPQETEGLFRTMAELRDEGYGVVFITHKLHEVTACADRIAVMRQGRIVATLARHEANDAALLRLMFGEASPVVATQRSASRQAPGALVLELDGIATSPAPGAAALHDVSLALHGGEILGVAGVSGNGQSELAESILGLRRPLRGVKRLWGEDATRWSVSRICDCGVASIPDDPTGLAIVPGLSVRENLALGSGRRYHLGLDLDWQRLAADMEASRAKLHFPPLALDTRAAALSGGNQQRLVVTRELAHDPRLIVALYPTHGLDARSTAAVRAVFDQARVAGAAVLLFSEELEELFVLCDRLIVLREGRIAGSFAPDSFDVTAIGSCMVGTADAA